MNKKIWIGLISVFLVIALVLGFQMSREKTKSEGESIPDDKVVITELENEPVILPAGDEEPIDTEENNGLEPPEQTDQPEEEPDIVPEDPPNVTPDKPEESKPTDKPEVKPVPEEPAKPVETKPVEDKKMYVTLSVSVKTLLDKKDTLKPEKWELVPKNGWIFPAEKVEFFEGESAFNVLLREMKKNKIHMEFIMTPVYNSNYIQGIGNLYEFDCGELSGWMYSVNNESPNLGTSNYILKDGDNIKLLYTCDLGRDIGYEFNE